MKKLLPIILLIFGLGGGVGAGVALKPAHDAEADTCVPAEGAAVSHETVVGTEPAVLDHDYIKMSNQFVVPVVSDDRIKALVVMSISLEVVKGASEQVYAREPKLRDAFLRVMFDHANAGGFDGAFTENGNMAHLRDALLAAGKAVLGETVSDVLIIDIVRQDN